MSRKQLIENWVAAFNNQDVQALANCYHNDAINHQMPFEPLIGKEAITRMFEEDFSKAHMTCLIENIMVDGQWAALEWRDPLGLRGCGFFLITDEKIQMQRGYWDKLSFLRQQGLPLPAK